MLDSYRYYMDLTNEIELLEYQIQESLNERNDWYFTGRLGSKYRLDVASEKLDKLAERIEWLVERLERKKEIKKRIEGKLKELEGIEYKVAYMRVVESKQLEEIAQELNFSVDWIKKVSAKVTRHLEYTDLLQVKV